MAKKPLISVVDDDDAVRESLRALLRSVKFVVEVFASAEEFLSSDRARETDCLILDVRMPGGGVEAARQMRRWSPATSIIALSAYEDRDNVASMVGAGAQAYLVKGRVTSDDVVRAIRQAAGRA